MGAIGFVLFLTVTGWLLNKARDNGEFDITHHPPTKLEQRRLNKRFWSLFTPCVTGLWILIMSSIRELDGGLFNRYFSAYALGFGLVSIFFGAGLAALINGALEHTGFRIRKPYTSAEVVEPEVKESFLKRGIRRMIEL